MIGSNRFAQAGALLLAACLVGYALYELILYPGAGFPTSDYAVIVRGADTLRIGHWLKFGFAISLALLVVDLYPGFLEKAPLLARLGVLAGTSAITLFLASGFLGLRILAVAEDTFSTDPTLAITTILLRTVTLALYDAATFSIGGYALLVGLSGLSTTRLPRLLSVTGIILGLLFMAANLLPDGIILLAPLASIPWLVWLAAALVRQPHTPVGRAS
jgi:hypothetical protein